MSCRSSSRLAGGSPANWRSMSVATTSPDGPTRPASQRAIDPPPTPTSSTRSPGVHDPLEHVGAGGIEHRAEVLEPAGLEVGALVDPIGGLLARIAHVRPHRTLGTRCSCRHAARRKAEHTLADHVAVDLLGPAADAPVELAQELSLPVPVLGRVLEQHPGAPWADTAVSAARAPASAHRSFRTEPSSPLTAAGAGAGSRDADVRVDDSLPQRARSVRRSTSTCERDERVGIAGDPVTAPDHRRLVGERRAHDRPSAVHLADDVPVGNTDVGEEHLVELGGAVDLAQRPHLDARGCACRG